MSLTTNTVGYLIDSWVSCVKLGLRLSTN